MAFGVLVQITSLLQPNEAFNARSWELLLLALQSSKKSRQQEQGKLKKDVPIETTTSTTALVNMRWSWWKRDRSYNAVPPPYTINFMPPTPDLSFTGLDEFVNEPIVENKNAKSSEKEPKVVRKNNDALIIEE
ncbi:hypothetical protein Tco_0602522 [Tanacetum coccineum]